MFEIGKAVRHFVTASSTAPGRVVMMRHGQSVWNDLNRWAGWADVKLSGKGTARSQLGVQEAREAGRVIQAEGIVPDVAYTSMMSRTIQTFNHIADVLDCHYVPLVKSWRLNEKHYGDLQGKNRSEVIGKYGQAQVQLWRRSYDVRPPALDPNDPRHPINDPRYKFVDPAVLPVTESLKDTIARVQPIWQNDIIPQLQKGRNVLLVAHGNTLRSIIKVLDGISDSGIVELNIPTAIPILYSFNKDLSVLSKRYLGNEQQILKRTNEVKNQGAAASIIPA